MGERMTGKTIRTILVDDEPLALRGLELRLSDFPDIEILAQCANGREALRAIRELRPDLVFLDIQMPELDGFHVIKALAAEPMPLIVFVTAFDQYALNAFEAHALDYLLKPLDGARLMEAVTRARAEIAQRQAIERNARLISMLREIDPAAAKLAALDAAAHPSPPYESRLVIRDRGQVTLLDVDDIDWIDAAGDYMCIQAAGRSHILRETMKNMERRLDPAKFGRIHRSTIINFDRVERLIQLGGGDYMAILKTGEELRIGRAFREKLLRFIS